MPKQRTKPAKLNGETRRVKAKEKAPAQPQAPRPKAAHHAKDRAAPGPAKAPVRAPVSAEVRQRLEAALAEERLEQTLFGPSGRAETITVSVTPAVLNDLAFLTGYFEQGYGRGRRTNKSALVRLAIRTLRYWLDPTGMPPQSELPFEDFDGEQGPPPPFSGEGSSNDPAEM